MENYNSKNENICMRMRLHVCVCVMDERDMYVSKMRKNVKV